MSENARRQLIVQPPPDMLPEIGRAVWMLENARLRTLPHLTDLDSAELDRRPEWALHSIGTLLYHIAMVEVDWLLVEVQGHPYDQPYPGDMAAWFPYPMRSDNRLTRIVGIGLDEHLQRLAVVRRALLDTFRAMSLEDFRRARALPESDVTPEWVLHHLCQHEAEHRAEIAVLRTGVKLLE